MQTEDALQKLMDALLLKVKKTRGLVKELKTQYIEGNVDVARPVVLYNCMSTGSPTSRPLRMPMTRARSSSSAVASPEPGLRSSFPQKYGLFKICL